MKKIVAYKPLPDDVLAYLREHAEVVQVDAAQHDAFVAALKDADGAIGASVKITPGHARRRDEAQGAVHHLGGLR